MSSSKTNPTSKLDVFRFTSQPRLDKPSLIVGWMKDLGDVSRGVADFLAGEAGGHSFCQIEPADFFSIGGVTVESNVATFPQSRFFYDERSNVLLLRSDEPQSRRYEFLSAVLDLAEHYAVESLYTVDGISSMISHTSARRVFGVFNGPDVQRRLRWYLPMGLRWKGMPRTSTYLLWLARQRHLPAVGLWVETPFYLCNSRDAQAVRAAAAMLGHIVGWNHDVDELNRLVPQEERLVRLRREDVEIDLKIQSLEQGESLDSDEQIELSEAIEGALRKHG